MNANEKDIYRIHEEGMSCSDLCSRYNSWRWETDKPNYSHRKIEGIISGMLRPGCLVATGKPLKLHKDIAGVKVIKAVNRRTGQTALYRIPLNEDSEKRLKTLAKKLKGWAIEESIVPF